MMRRGDRLAVAVRRENGEISVWQEELRPFLKRHKWLDIPLIRGLVSLVEALVLGYRALAYSANVQLEDQGQKPVSGTGMTLAFAGSFIIALGLMVFIPILAANALRGVLGEGRMLAVADGLIRMIIVFGYIAGVALLPHLRRYFEYHGAEHRAVSAFEAGQELNVESVQRFSSFHPRCGTSLVALVVVVKLLVLPLFGWGGWGRTLMVRFLALPVLLGISLEALRAAGKHPQVRPLQWLLLPGMWLQRLTAHQPTDAQVEVALAALKAVVRPGVPSGTGGVLPAGIEPAGHSG